jgi:hypothetical protein
LADAVADAAAEVEAEISMIEMLCAEAETEQVALIAADAILTNFAFATAVEAQGTKAEVLITF